MGERDLLDRIAQADVWQLRKMLNREITRTMPDDSVVNLLHNEIVQRLKVNPRG